MKSNTHHTRQKQKTDENISISNTQCIRVRIEWLSGWPASGQCILLTRLDNVQ